MTQFLPEPYHHFFVSFCPFCVLFTYSMLLPAISNQLPSSSFSSVNFCPTLAPQALSFLSCCISLSYFSFLILFPLPTSPPCGPKCCCCTAALFHSHSTGFHGPLWCSRSVCSLPAFVFRSVSPLPSLFSAFSSLGFLLSQGEVVSY